MYISGPPESPTKCQQRNHSTDTVFIDCEPGYDGGLKQVQGYIFNNVQENIICDIFVLVALFKKNSQIIPFSSIKKDSSYKPITTKKRKVT